MRVAITGQQDFGMAILASFPTHGKKVVEVFRAPEKRLPDSSRLTAGAEL